MPSATSAFATLVSLAAPEAGAESARWVPAPAVDGAERLAEAGYSQILAALLARRGIADAAEAERYLRPGLDDLHDPLALAGMTEAVQHLLWARDNQIAVVVVGDYDVDGVSATAQLLAVFGACGIAGQAILPHRQREGYGFQVEHVEQAVERGAGVIVTADCGSLSHDAVQAGLDAGLRVIVTDHHLPGAPLPEQAVHINPKQTDCDYPFAELCGAGLAFKLAIALAREAGLELNPVRLLRIASLGTIADMVPLTGENRAIAKLGLDALADTPSPGLKALFEVAAVRMPVGAGDVGFRIGPRLNAAGRLDSADPALQLLLTRDPSRARELAGRLDAWNDRRQRHEAKIVAEAEEALAEETDKPLLVAWSEQWHRGVVGIAAGRLARRHHRPTILLAVKDGVATGSGRSIRGVQLHEFLAAWNEKYDRFGGHAQAVGLTVRIEDLAALKSDWLDAASGWDPELLVRSVEYDAKLQAKDIGIDLVNDLAKLEPFGVGNRRPLFRVGPLQLSGTLRRFGTNHLGMRAAADDGTTVELVGWRWGDRADLFSERFEVLARLGLDRYLGRPSLEIVEARRWPEDA